MPMTKKQRQQRLGAMRSPTPGPKPVRIGQVHRAAALAGVPTTLPSIKSIQKGSTRKSEAGHKLRGLAFKGAAHVKRNHGGTGAVTMLHPGATGHERCKDICLVYS